MDYNTSLILATDPSDSARIETVIEKDDYKQEFYASNIITILLLGIDKTENCQMGL
jgi:hypothetical protein